MKYTLITRKKSTFANNNSEFVRWMRKNDVQNWQKNKDFIEGYAYRKATFEKIILRTSNEDVFIEDLQKNNLLKIENSTKSIWKLFSIK